jgi:hypothetical protein
VTLGSSRPVIKGLVSFSAVDAQLLYQHQAVWCARLARSTITPQHAPTPGLAPPLTKPPSHSQTSCRYYSQKSSKPECHDTDKDVDW